ncbi:damage-control phosphatase ARMT1 family protein [Parapedobacter sp. 10938]|uniref:damage-control phosphatase ARMT1 family protein n=1 Tax=Parapedobacter flavus TaxID=3110225 RepID=UPI002DBF953F|nr:damage-control phosphatase ARMT1 family protein [Parapedobacter sp. 10938]MEC3881762.1 damage-control phosphatase ARMT1 family protein [Parapedobacter sp. 10938]
MKSNLPRPISATTSPFAAFTFNERFPFIINQLRANNPLSPSQQTDLGNLLDEIATGVVPPADDVFYPEDRIYWKTFLADHAGKGVAEVPFFEAEAYIYYRIIRLVDHKHTGLDPFHDLKADSLKHHRDFAEAMASKHMQQPPVFNAEYFTALVHAALWGNSADLSQLETNDALIDPALRNNLVIDDSALLCDLIAAPASREVDVIADNAGLELLSDLFLIDYLLTTGQVSRVNLHLKAYPTFVSDATIRDFVGHLDILRGFHSEPVTQFVDRLEGHRAGGRLQLLDHPFWNSPCHFTKLPPAITQGFSDNTVLVFKGDANYRRLFEDREWPYTTPLEGMLDYLDRPCFSIRTLKSEIVLGLTEYEVQRLFEADKNWITNGKYGLIMGTQA